MCLVVRNQKDAEIVSEETQGTIRSMFTVERAKSPVYVCEGEGEGLMPSLPGLNSVGLLRSNKSGMHNYQLILSILVTTTTTVSLKENRKHS